MKIGIDVDSGERPFEELVKGAVEAGKRFPNIFIYLIGNQSKIQPVLDGLGNFNQIAIKNADEVIGMDESPIHALRKKKNSTVAVGCRMIKSGEIDVFFSPGNTGATVATSVIILGLINRIKKPAMVIAMPRGDGQETYIVDIGANPEPNDDTYWQNALLGASYYQVISDSINKPKIGLLNIGTENIKGSKNLKKAFACMSRIPKTLGTFVGNVEGYNIFDGSVDIVVCDGFTGNTVLKFAEAITGTFVKILKSALSSQTLGFFDKLVMAPAALFKTSDKVKQALKTKMTPRYFGAATLLGVKGTVLVGHGMCREEDVINAVALADTLYQRKYLERMITPVKK